MSIHASSSHIHAPQELAELPAARHHTSGTTPAAPHQRQNGLPTQPMACPPGAPELLQICLHELLILI